MAQLGAALSRWILFVRHKVQICGQLDIRGEECLAPVSWMMLSPSKVALCSICALLIKHSYAIGNLTCEIRSLADGRAMVVGSQKQKEMDL